MLSEKIQPCVDDFMLGIVRKDLDAFDGIARFQSDDGAVVRLDFAESLERRPDRDNVIEWRVGTREFERIGNTLQIPAGYCDGWTRSALRWPDM